MVLVALLLLALPLAVAKTPPPRGRASVVTEFFVDCGHGDDTAAGTAAAPFATLRAARDAARRVGASSSPSFTTVNVVGGEVCRSWQNADNTTQQNATLELDSRDSHTAWRSVGGAVVLSGGVPVNSSLWKQLTPRQRRLFKAAVADKVISLDLHSLVNDVGQLQYLQIAAGDACIRTDLYSDSQVELIYAPPVGSSATALARKLVLARYPNLIDPPVTSNWLGVQDADNKQHAFTVDASAAQRESWSAQLAAGGQIFAHGLWAYNWADTHRRLLNASSAANGGARLILQQPPAGATGDANLQTAVQGQQGGHAYLYNAHFELDEESEYSIDHISGTLYFLPPSEILEAPGGMGRFELTVASTVLRIRGAANISFSGFEFRGARGAGVVIDHSTGILLANGSIADSGSQALNVSGGTASGAYNMILVRAGKGGAVLDGGDRQTLTASSHFVRDSKVRDCNRWLMNYAPLVAMAGVGQEISGSVLANAPQLAVFTQGNLHSMVDTEIRDVVQQCSDCGAYYFGRDWT